MRWISMAGGVTAVCLVVGTGLPGAGALLAQPTGTAQPVGAVATVNAAAQPVTQTQTEAQSPSTTPLPAPSSAPEAGKGKKGSATAAAPLAVLPPTPMLDEEGRQRLDPDGKPMFNAPIRQQRDKHGRPLFDDAGKPVFQTAKDLGYDENGKRLHAAKEKEPKAMPLTVSRGVYTVDGMPGKAALNYDIADLRYIYLWAPGVGIAVISNEPFAGATEEKNAFDDKTLTVSVADHTLQVASDVRLMKDKKPQNAYVMLDRDFRLPSRYPAMGYGDTRHAPYAWPGSRANTTLTSAAYAPPPPADMLPVQLLAACPAGQMRMPAPKVLPGQQVPSQPCVPLAQAEAVRARMASATRASVVATSFAPAASATPTQIASPAELASPTPLAAPTSPTSPTEPTSLAPASAPAPAEAAPRA